MANYLLSKEIAYRKLHRMAYEVVERNFEENEIIIAGIKESGSIVAGVLINYLKEIFSGSIQSIDIIIDKKDPKKIQSLVLVERSHRQFPVASDYVGMSVATALSEKIIVETDASGILGARLET